MILFFSRRSIFSFQSIFYKIRSKEGFCMKKKNEAVIVFDSGVGGLTTLKEILQLKLYGPFVYVADTKNSPYGNKNKKQVVDYVLSAFSKIEENYSFKSIILACNTATAYTKNLLKNKYKVPVFSVTDAAIAFTNKLKNFTTIDVLSTYLTKKSHIYKKNITHNYVREIECPDFVPFIESDNFFDLSERKKVVAHSLVGKATENSHLVILGCTHYPLLNKEIQSFYGPNTILLNPSLLLAQELKEHFREDVNQSEVNYFTTSSTNFFDKMATSIMGMRINSVPLQETKITSFI